MFVQNFVDTQTGTNFSNGAQHDAQEFASLLIDSLHEDMNVVSVRIDELCVFCSVDTSDSHEPSIGLRR